MCMKPQSYDIVSLWIHFLTVLFDRSLSSLQLIFEFIFPSKNVYLSFFHLTFIWHLFFFHSAQWNLYCTLWNEMQCNTYETWTVLFRKMQTVLFFKCVFFSLNQGICLSLFLFCSIYFVTQKITFMDFYWLLIEFVPLVGFGFVVFGCTSRTTLYKQLKLKSLSR